MQLVSAYRMTLETVFTKKGFPCTVCVVVVVLVSMTVVMPGSFVFILFLSLKMRISHSLPPTTPWVHCLSSPPSFGAHIHSIKGRFQENVHQALPYMNDAPLFGCNFISNFLNQILCYPPLYRLCLFLFSPASTLNSVIFVLYVIQYMYKCCNYFNWSLSCFLVLADWLSFYLFWVCYSLLAMRRTHIWLCVISVVYDYLFCEPDVFAPPFFPPLYLLLFKLLKPHRLV